MAMSAGAGSLGGSAIGGAFGLAGSITSGVMAKNSAKKQMSFQRKMDNTKRRRDMIDLRAAGLNPILASGFSNTSPSGALAQVPDYGGAITKGMEAGSGTGLKVAQSKLLDAQTGAATEQERANKSLADKAAAEAILLQAGIPKAQLEAMGYQRLLDNAKIINNRTSAWDVKTAPGLLRQLNAHAGPGATIPQATERFRKWYFNEIKDGKK